jgi:hypothetical protein
MPIRRVTSPWQSFIALLPDLERRDDLTATLNDLRRGRGVDFNQVYAALCDAKATAEQTVRVQKTLRTAQAWLRQCRGVLRALETGE